MTLILSGTDGLSDIDGSAATPAIRGTDANTGIFFGTDTVGISTGGTTAVSISASQVVTLANALPVASGGTGGATYTANNVLLGNGTSAFQTVAPGTSGNLLTSNGTTWTSAAAPSGMIYPGAGIPNSTGSAWGTSYSTTGTGTVVALATSPSFTTPVLGTPTSGNLANCTFPTLNQNTTGSSATVTGNATGSTFGFNSGYGSVATAYGCRAWVNFNGTGTVAIRGSGNVSSITDNGTGAYTVNFSTAMPDANYCTNATGTHDGGAYVAWGTVANDTPPTTSAVRTDFLNNAGSTTDVSFAQVSIIR
jgi:hypothetical protein